MASKWDINLVRNIGISAHTTAGKENFSSERILFYGGKFMPFTKLKEKTALAPPWISWT